MGQVISFKRSWARKSQPTTAELPLPAPADQDSTGPPPRMASPFKDKRHLDPFSMLSHEKKYYEFDESPQPYPVFIKRNLTPDEYVKISDERIIVPYMTHERMKNEVASIQFIKKHTSIPVPNIRCAFEDNGRYFIITDIVPGVIMAQLPQDKKEMVIEKLQEYISEMHSLKSKVLGGVLGDVCIPYRLIEHIEPEIFRNLPEADTAEYSFCHNDLSQHNIILDEETLKINAILDWEYAGFFPADFDRPFYLRKGPSVAIDDEIDDSQKLLEFMNGLVAQI